MRGEEGRDVSSPRLLPQDHNLHCMRSSGLPGACTSPDLLLRPLTSPLRKSPLSERLNPSEASERPPARCPTSSQNREMTGICIGKNSLGLHGPALHATLWDAAMRERSVNARFKFRKCFEGIA